MNEKIVEVLSEVFSISPDEVTSELTAESLGQWDSLNHLRMVTMLEESLGVRFTMDEIRMIDSVAAIEKLLQEKSQAVD